MIKVKEIEDGIFVLFQEAVNKLFRKEAIKKTGRIKKGNKITYYVTIQY